MLFSMGRILIFWRGMRRDNYTKGKKKKNRSLYCKECGVRINMTFFGEVICVKCKYPSYPVHGFHEKK